MALNTKKNINLIGTSVVTISDGQTTREVEIEGYSVSIDSERPESINFSKYFKSKEAEDLFAENRAACRADYAAFMQAGYELQDEMLAALNAE